MNGLIKIFGGKYFLKHWIIENFPGGYEDMEYFEPCVGAGNIILNKNKSVKETISDANPNLMALWRSVQCLPNHLQELLKDLYYTEETFERYRLAKPTTDLSIGIKEYVISRMSRAGLKRDFAWSERLRGGLPGDENAWNNSINNLPIISERIKNANIIHESVVNSLLRTIDNTNTLFYIDCPYLHETRITKNAYEFEMTFEQHEEYLDIARIHEGKLLISGYWSQLYMDKLNGWNTTTKKIVNHSSQQKHKSLKEEVLWKNY